MERKAFLSTAMKKIAGNTAGDGCLYCCKILMTFRLSRNSLHELRGETALVILSGWDKASPGIDGMTVEELTGYLHQHWPAIREQLSQGTYEPNPCGEWK